MHLRTGIALSLPIIAAFSAIMMSCALAAPSEKPTEINIVPVIVRTPHSGFNRLTVSVTVCEPGTDRCTTIDDVMLDTGSTGLRLESSAVPTWMRLPAFLDSLGKPMAECLRFVHDAAWGPLVKADLRMGGLTAINLPIQIIADDGRPQPDNCPISTVKPTSNGTLGVGPHLFDCQGSCEQSPTTSGVFVEDGGTWFPVKGAVPIESRLPNPVSRFGQHGNGVVIDLPASPDDGAAQVTGTLTFGVGTAPNNQLGAARMVRIDGRGHFATIYGGVAYPESYIDSGTETYILADNRLPRCVGMTWAFCATPAQTLDAVIVGADGVQVPVKFKVGDYRGALDRHVGAWDGFAEATDPSSRMFVWGAPFFFGRRVYVVLDGASVPGVEGVSGPLYGIQ